MAEGTDTSHPPTRPPRPQVPLRSATVPLERDTATVPLERDTAISSICRQGNAPKSQREVIEPVPVRKTPQSVVDLCSEESLGKTGLGTSDCGQDDDTCPITGMYSTKPCGRTGNGTETELPVDDIALLPMAMIPPSVTLNQEVGSSQGSRAQSPPPSLQGTPPTSSLEIRRPPRPPNRPPPPRPPVCDPPPPRPPVCEPVLCFEDNSTAGASDDTSQIEPIVSTVSITPVHNAPNPLSPTHTHSSSRPPRPPRPLSVPTKHQHGINLNYGDTGGSGDDSRHTPPSAEVEGEGRPAMASDGQVPSGGGGGGEVSPSQGNRFIRSMRKTFKSLQVRMTSHRGSSPYASQRDRSPRGVGRTRNAATLPHIRHKREEDSRETEALYPDPLPNGVIDPLVIQCVSYLNREHILDEEGLFRVPGDVATIRRLRGQFVMGDAVDLNTILDPHTVAGLMKAYFREQKTSIIPRGEPLAAITKAVEQKNPTAMSQILYSIGINQTATLRMVAELMMAVVGHSHKNRMTTGTLGTSMGPSLFPYLPPSTASLVLTFMVDHVTEIFNT